MDWNQLRNAAATMADKVVNATGEVVEKGKKQVDILNLESRLARAQRQLGALVYSLAQNGEQQPDLVEQYIQEIAEIEQQLNDVASEKKETVTVFAKAVRLCSHCKEKVEEDAVYCPYCGQKL